MQVTVDLPDELAGVLHEWEPHEDRALLVETVCGLYARGRISGGKAARLLGLDRFAFQQELAKREIAQHYTMEELQHDLAFARGQ
jgi:predicted HTH domain antitoxin